MVDKERSSAPTTLMQAHELLTQARPRAQASTQTRLTYYRRSAAMYAEMAEIDRGHHHECLYWATRERAKADELQARIAKNPNESTSDGTVQTEQ